MAGCVTEWPRSSRLYRREREATTVPPLPHLQEMRARGASGPVGWGRGGGRTPHSNDAVAMVVLVCTTHRWTTTALGWLRALDTSTTGYVRMLWPLSRRMQQQDSIAAHRTPLSAPAPARHALVASTLSVQYFFLFLFYMWVGCMYAALISLKPFLNTMGRRRRDAAVSGAAHALLCRDAGGSNLTRAGRLATPRVLFTGPHHPVF